MSACWPFAPLRPVFFRSIIFQYHHPRLPNKSLLPRHQLSNHSTAEIQPLDAEERIYHPQSDVEDLEGYRPGGYHPTVIGETLCDGRYEIIHKLGYGGYSTIWLAHDQQRQRYVSLKILVAAASRDNADNESKILRLLSKGGLEHPGRRFIPTLLDQFSFDGPNGHHQCLVGEPAGCSIASSKENSTNLMFPRDAARSIAAQLVMGLDYLHANDICHGGMYVSLNWYLFNIY